MNDCIPKTFTYFDRIGEKIVSLGGYLPEKN